MSLKRNLFASLGSSVWSAVIGLAVVPVYLHYLGVEAYGLIGLLGTFQALFSLLELGLAPAVNREVAAAKSEQDLEAVRELLHTLSYVYWVTGLLILGITALIAPIVATQWIHASLLSDRTVVTAVTLMGLVVACRWPSALYLGALIGAERIALSSLISVITTSTSTLGAIAILALTEPRVESVFAWQATIGLAQAFAMRQAAWNVLGRTSGAVFSIQALQRVWRFSAGLSGIALSALLLTQVDKVILSRSLSLAAFGQYSIATVVASGLYLLITPTFNIAFPRFTSLKAAGAMTALDQAFRYGTRTFLFVLSTVAMLLAVFAADLLRAWTGNTELASTVAPVIGLLAIGVTLHGAMFFPYALQLAHGNTRLPLTINSILVVIAIPVMALLSWKLQLLGGGIASVVLFSVYLLLGTWLTHAKLPSLVDLRWLVRDVLTPISCSSALGLIGMQILATTVWSPFSKLILAAALATSSLVMAAFLTPPKVFSYLRSRPSSTEGH